MINDFKIPQQMRVALYARVSTEEQKDNYSIDAQKDLLRKYVNDNNYVLHDEYIDEGYSGAKTDRPEFQRMMRDARDRKIDMVLVYKLDRFFRSNMDLLNTIDQLSKYDVCFKSMTEPFDTSNYMGKFMVSMLGGIAELERNTFVERSKMGKLRRYREGYYAGSAVFGYDYDKETDDLTINQNEGEIVKLIFSEYSKPDSSLVKVARRLRQNGYKTKEGKQFQSHAIHEIITNSMYMGKWYANRMKGKSGKKPKEEWIEVAVPPIISETEYMTAQRLLQQRKLYSKRNAKQEYLLQGIAKCGDCGSTIAGTRDEQTKVVNGKVYGPYIKLYYRCTHYSKNLFEKSKKCSLRYIRAEPIEHAVWDQIESLLKNPKQLTELIEKKQTMEHADVRNLEKEMRAEQKKLVKCQAAAERLVTVYRDGIIQKEQLKTQLDELNSLSDGCTSRINAITEMLHDDKTSSEVKGAINYIEAINKGFGKLNTETKNKILKLLGTKITVNTNGIAEIDLNLPHSFTAFAPPECTSWLSAA